MRITLALLALAACTPDIAPGSYLCGPEGLCPEGQLCNGPDNICVLVSEARPFSCGTATDPDVLDDQPGAGTVLANLPCVSVPSETHGCLLDDDGQDFFQFDVPAGCAAVRVEASVSFPIAFQPLGLVFSTAGRPGGAGRHAVLVGGRAGRGRALLRAGGAGRRPHRWASSRTAAATAAAPAARPVHPPDPARCPLGRRRPHLELAVRAVPRVRAGARRRRARRGARPRRPRAPARYRWLCRRGKCSCRRERGRKIDVVSRYSYLPLFPARQQGSGDKRPRLR